MTRDQLHSVPLASVWPLQSNTLSITMGRNQWDAMLEAAYRAGWVLLELDDDERPLAAYQKAAH
mgnify:CR=1 FL=1